MACSSTAAEMLGSQADETVLVEQPDCYITQKARVKRNRRTEWDYYVQFPGFPEDEGTWFSARTIKTRHPRGAELIREFDRPDDRVDVTPPPSVCQAQSAPPAVPFTQDGGPSQIGSDLLCAPNNYSQLQQPQTQDHFASQLQRPAEYIASASAAPKPSFQMHHMHGLQIPAAQDMFSTASQDTQPVLHWSFDRMQQASQHPNPQAVRPMQGPQGHHQAGSQHQNMPMQFMHGLNQATSMPEARQQAGLPGQVAEQTKRLSAFVTQPGWVPAQPQGLHPGFPSRPQPGLHAAPPHALRSQGLQSQGLHSAWQQSMSAAPGTVQ